MIEQQVPPSTDPDSIPMEDRKATLTIVWTKDDKILMRYPQEVPIALKMLALGFYQLIDLLNRMFQDTMNAMKQNPAIVKAAANAIPAFDPRFLKKNN